MLMGVLGSSQSQAYGVVIIHDGGVDAHAHLIALLCSVPTPSQLT